MHMTLFQAMRDVHVINENLHALFYASHLASEGRI